MTPTEEPEWIAQARILIANGGTVLEVARYLGKSTDGLRFALNINGAREKQKARVRRSRERENAERVGGHSRLKPRKHAVEAGEERSAARAYADPKPARPLTLPKISLPDLDEPRAIRIAPVSRVAVNLGAERIRAIHLRMIRRGLIAERGLVEEFAS